MSKEEISSGFKPCTKLVYYLFLGFSVEINKHIPAKNDIEQSVGYV
jgi:hypothetical protein